MDIEEIIDSFPKPLLALLLLLFFVAKVVWSAAGSNVNTVTSMKEWDEFIEDAKKENKLVVVHFHSAWCKVSKITAPLFRQWCKDYPEAKFVKVYVDTLTELKERYKVRMSPSFGILLNGDKLHFIEGAHDNKVRGMIEAQLDNLDRQAAKATGTGNEKQDDKDAAAPLDTSTVDITSKKDD
mmetsp:Transcript_17606/g.29664  ORF Transcript_17606/g.29664 Transcript_17606/m.29664 type:complete len:182 (-) Transcript_17606:461-1006(-)